MFVRNQTVIATAAIFSVALSGAAFGPMGCDNSQGQSTTTASASASTSLDEPPLGDPAGSSDERLPDDDAETNFDDGEETTPQPSASGDTPQPKTSEPNGKKGTSKKKRKTEPKTEPKGTEPAPEPTPEPAPAVPQTLDTPEEGSADAVALQIDKVYDPIKLFRARFNQSYTAKIHKTTKKSKGVLYVAKPGKLSLSYHDPNKNRAVSDGTTLKVYEHDNKQMFVKNVSNTEYPGAFSFILGKGLRQSFTFKFHKTSKFEGGPVIVGTPRVANPGYKQVIFYVDEELLKKGDLGCIRRVLVIDAQGNKNRFDFVAAEEPESIPDKWFTFEPPPGTEIIKG